jgi:hypothetical protein
LRWQCGRGFKRPLVWLGWQDSNLRMPGSKPGALPLGDTPTDSSLPCVPDGALPDLKKLSPRERAAIVMLGLLAVKPPERERKHPGTGNRQSTQSDMESRTR